MHYVHLHNTGKPQKSNLTNNVLKSGISEQNLLTGIKHNIKTQKTGQFIPLGGGYISGVLLGFFFLVLGVELFFTCISFV